MIVIKRYPNKTLNLNCCNENYYTAKCILNKLFRIYRATPVYNSVLCECEDGIDKK